MRSKLGPALVASLPSMPKNDSSSRLDRIVTEARRARELRESGYRDQALKLFAHLCGRCGREFAGATLRMLTVHHRDGNHDNNPADGSNWELLCLYCHDAEHSRGLDDAARAGAPASSRGAAPATHRPFAGLEALLKGRK